MTATTFAEPRPPAPGGPAAEYQAAVAAALAGVPDPDRQEMLDDLAEHLAELVSEVGPDEDPAASLRARLGEPAAYAAELLASAGIEAPPADPGAPTRPPGLWSRGRALAHRVADSSQGRSLRAFLPELRPAWWVLRAWTLMALWAVAAGRDVFPVPHVLGNVLVDLALLVGLAVASVRLGRGEGPRWLDRLATVLAVLGALLAVTTNPTRTVYVDYGYSQPDYGLMTTADGRLVTNIWPVDASGEVVEGIFLFDQDGMPLVLDPAASGVELDGVVVPGLFPQSQLTYEYDPRTGQDRRVPVAAPDVRLPRIPEAGGATTTVATPGPTTTAAGEATTTTVAEVPAPPAGDPAPPAGDPAPPDPAAEVPADPAAPPAG